MEQTTIDINNGTNQIAPNATVQQQIFLGDKFAEVLTKSKDTPVTMVVLGAGAETAMGMPTSSRLIPAIVEYIATPEGMAVDAALRKAIGGVRFHFDRFVNNAIDNLAKDLDKELETICRNISEELASNTSLTDEQRKLGMLITRIFRKIIDIKCGAAIDDETESLISEVLGTTVKDDSIIDFSRINYTETFRNVIVAILEKSITDGENPILRHVYRNILDIEQLLSQYFYAFYTGRKGQMRDYLYISWMLWAFLVSREQQMAGDGATGTILPGVYGKLHDTDAHLLTFNYTTLAGRCSDKAIYFHGSLLCYVDVENKNDFRLDNITDISLPEFFSSKLAAEISFDDERKAIPIPSFLPPMKLQTVISRHYISTWYQTYQLMLRARRILFLGYSFATIDSFFCDMLRENRDASIVITDKNIDDVSRNLCHILQMPVNRYTRQIRDNAEYRIYDNRITIIQADLDTFDITPWLSTPNHKSLKKA